MRRRRLRMWRCGMSGISRTSSAERVIFPGLDDSGGLSAGEDGELDRQNCWSIPARMLKNLESTGGADIFWATAAGSCGVWDEPEDAYRLVQGHAMRSWKEELVFRDEVAKDPAITGRLTPERSWLGRLIMDGNWRMWMRSLRGFWGEARVPPLPPPKCAKYSKQRL